MHARRASSSLKKLLVGLLLRCPNCEQGRIMQGLFALKPTCPICGVRFERDPGEGTGAMMIVLSLLPLIVLFFVLYSLLAVPLLVLLALIIAALLALALLLYRHARGVWVSIIFLSSGLFTDAEKPYTR